MSGRIVNVRPKPGFVIDASGAVIQAGGNVVPLRAADKLVNAFTGTGTGKDPRSANTYYARPLTQYEIAAAYSGSGLMRKIVQIPALDMVREWRDWAGLDDDQAAAVFDEEKRLGLRQKVRQAEVLRGMGGGALILGLPGMPSQPAPDGIGTGKLAFVHVVSRWQLAFERLQDDATKPGFGEPEMWKLSTTTGQTDVHPSRVVPFRADTTAALAMPMQWGLADAFWGESTVQQVLDAVQDNDTARGAFAALVHKARLLRIGVPGLLEWASTEGGTAKLQSRFAALTMAESIYNAVIYDAGDPESKGGEKIDDASYNFAGAKDVMNAFAEFVAAISDIPATRLLGRAPEGLNSSGDSQQDDWDKMVRARQTLELDPCMDRVNPYLFQSAIGAKVKTASNEWAPLDTPSQKETAERFKTQMEAVEKLVQFAAMPERALNRGIQSLMVEEGYLPELEAALAEIPDDERYGVQPDPSADPAELDLTATEGGDPTQSAGPGGSQQPPRRANAANDAAPRSLYVQRRLLNAAEVIKWAKAQDFDTTLPAADMHVTVLFSRQAVDWMKMGAAWDQQNNGELVVPPGGARLVEPLGDKGAVVLLFNSSSLSWRHEDMVRNGASHDFDDYQPHVTITYSKPDGLELATVEPYRGELRFGPEVFEEINDDWAANVEEA